MKTIWGTAQTVDKVGNGIYFVTTSSHGGIKVSLKRLNEMPKSLQNVAHIEFNSAWFEEDCAWSAAYLAFPKEMQDFDKERYGKTYEIAKQTLAHYFPKALQNWQKENTKKE